MKEKSKILECALEGIQLSEDEVRLGGMDYGMGLVDSTAVFTDCRKMSHVYKGRARPQPPKSQLGEEIICYLSWKLYVN